MGAGSVSNGARMTRGKPSSLFDRPGALYELGLLNVKQDRLDAAWELAEAISSERSGNAELAAIARRILSKGIDDYHQPMLLDSARSRAYHEAIMRDAPGKIVLDIGTGSGLLAMMAAKAGAAQVVACEQNTILARTARKIIESNGLTDRITLHECASTQLDAGRDLFGGAELVVSELFSCDLVGEGAIPSLNHASSELCKGGAEFLPPRCSIRVALVNFTDRLSPIGEIEGLDLSLFERFAQPVEIVPSDNPAILQRGPAQDLFTFEFQAGSNVQSEGEAVLDLVSSGGTVNAVAQWLSIDFGDGIEYENSPCSPNDVHWHTHITFLTNPLESEAGQAVRIHGRHTRNLLVIWDEL